jgi:hypothetical protein
MIGNYPWRGQLQDHIFAPLLQTMASRGSDLSRWWFRSQIAQSPHAQTVIARNIARRQLRLLTTPLITLSRQTRQISNAVLVSDRDWGEKPIRVYWLSSQP